MYRVKFKDVEFYLCERVLVGEIVTFEGADTFLITEISYTKIGTTRMMLNIKGVPTDAPCEVKDSCAIQVKDGDNLYELCSLSETPAIGDIVLGKPVKSVYKYYCRYNGSCYITCNSCIDIS